ncbi:MAG TPA: hypothetical protein VLL95_16190 [Phnomibacter sp.]|nr:hypothetical protein [Phnomibacter sp.]
MKSLLLGCILMLGMAATAQKSPPKIPVKGELVKVKEWGGLSVYIMGSFFNETKADIIGKIGEEEFNIMKDRCTEKGWPEGFYNSDNEEERNSLKMYRIAAYTHIFNGKSFQEYAILRIPYEENKGWKPNVKWEGNLYFLVPNEAVTIAQ